MRENGAIGRSLLDWKYLKSRKLMWEEWQMRFPLISDGVVWQRMNNCFFGLEVELDHQI